MEIVYTKVKGGCCHYCNPVSLADFETECARVTFPGGKTVDLCEMCVMAMQSTLSTGYPVKVQIPPEVADLVSDEIRDRSPGLWEVELGLDWLPAGTRNPSHVRWSGNAEHAGDAVRKALETVARRYEGAFAAAIHATRLGDTVPGLTVPSMDPCPDCSPDLKARPD